MARLIRTLLCSPSSSKYLASNFLLQSRTSTCLLPLRSRSYTKNAIKGIPESPIEANILRILHNEIEYHTDYAPPHQPATAYESFKVEDRPGEQWMTMRRRFNESEDVKLEATMFDGFERFSIRGEEGLEEDMRLHITLLVDVSKDRDSGDRSLEFICSAWPDCLEVHKVYFVSRGNKDTMPVAPYTGPDFRKLNGELQKELRWFLDERGVNDKLSVFLHEYMMNKDRIELIRWFGKAKSFVEN